ncbi:hypothetical protein V501_05677 [Pseudogymnoascus sp. VKM F-4519 (FW-2642)]|nr:hypothetical protein V501_05677 [Pseudogymnoascus sp. VKM F-4519 (FW-2642)]
MYSGPVRFEASGREEDPELQFITVTKPGYSQKRQNEHVVRSHAMKHVQRRVRAKLKHRQPMPFRPSYDTNHRVSDSYSDTECLLSHAGEPSSSREKPPIPRTSLNELSRKSEQMPECLDLRNKISIARSGPKTLLGPGSIDPFNTLPDINPSSYRASYLLSHFVDVFAPALLSVSTDQGANPLKMVFAREAIADQALFHATLFFAAAHFDILHGQSSSSDTLMHRGKAIHLINMNLSSSADRLSDSTIGAVTLMAIYEIINGNLKDLNLHMDALKKMVTLKGGLQALGMHGVLHMLISCQDSLSSTITSSIPRFPPVQCITTLPYITSGSFVRGSRVNDSVTHGIPDSVLPLWFHNHPMTVLNDLRTMTSIMNSFKGGRRATTGEMMSFSKMKSSLERRLLSSLRQQDQWPGTQQNYITCQGYYVAALIYINYTLRQFSPTFAVLRVLKQRLIDNYEKGGLMNPVDEASLGISFWVLCIGSLVSLTESEKVWLAERVANIMDRMKLKSWKDAEECLIGLIWTEQMSEVICKSFWHYVEIAQFVSLKISLTGFDNRNQF